jgi:acetyl-CoA carboxylase biotin carboxyl carrier protein
MQLTDEDVRVILRLLDGSAFNELQLETDSFRLSLHRVDGGWAQESAILRAASLLQPALAPVGVPASAVAVAGASNATQQGLVDVSTPLPGTFYRAPKPGSPPFVEVGSHVEPDTVIAIVETMKLMNSVSAGAGGQVVEICLADAQFAEQGVVLMRIRPVTT